MLPLPDPHLLLAATPCFSPLILTGLFLDLAQIAPLLVPALTPSPFPFCEL